MCECSVVNGFRGWMKLLIWICHEDWCDKLLQWFWPGFVNKSNNIKQCSFLLIAIFKRTNKNNLWFVTILRLLQFCPNEFIWRDSIGIQEGHRELIERPFKITLRIAFENMFDQLHLPSRMKKELVELLECNSNVIFFFEISNTGEMASQNNQLTDSLSP